MREIEVVALMPIKEADLRYWMHMVPHWLSYAPEGEKAAKVFDRNYHFGGWRPLDGWQVIDQEKGHVKYPGDPVLKPFAKIVFGDEIVYAYPHEVWGIMQKDGSFEASRMD